MKGPPLGCRSSPVKLGAAQPWRRRRGWEQPRQRRDGSVLPDGPGPASETGRCTYCRNQWWNPRKRETGSKSGGSGPGSSARSTSSVGGRLGRRLRWPARRPRGRSAAYPWRGCRGIAGHRPRRPVDGERGNRPGTALPAGCPGRWRAGPPSAVGRRTGRSRRSSPRSGEPATRPGSGGAWRRAAASPQPGSWHARRTPVNTDAPWPTAEQAGARVLGIQTKLHRWATRHSPPAWARGEPDAWERARPVRRCGPGKRATRNGDTAPRPDPYKAGPAGGRLRRPSSAGRPRRPPPNRPHP
jgi:hypothetical protein